MIKNIIVIIFMMFLNLSLVCTNCLGLQGDINMDEAAAFYANALKNEQIVIVLCEEKSFDKEVPKASDFEKHEEYANKIDEYLYEEYGLLTGENLLHSNYTKHRSDWQSLYVIEAIKGTFDRIVVYQEFGVVTGRDYPAFNAPNFAPFYDSQWIVVFKCDPKGEKVIFEDSDRTLPVLELASKDYGIIRYDAPNHLDIDAEKFLEDLQKLTVYKETDHGLFSADLQTELGKKIYELLDKD
jgi:hypothetical protein